MAEVPEPACVPASRGGNPGWSSTSGSRFRGDDLNQNSLARPAVLANQAKIAGNQKKLDLVLANQKAIVTNQKKILAKK